jgi:hypothetical protein
LLPLPSLPRLGRRTFLGLKIMASPSMVRRVCSSGRGMCLALESNSGGGGGTLGFFGLVPSGDGPNESCRRRALGGGPDRPSGDDGCDVEGDAVVGLGGRPPPPPGLAGLAAGPRSRPLSPPAMAAISANASAAAFAGCARGLLCGVVAGDAEAEEEETAPNPGDGGWAA